MQVVVKFQEVEAGDRRLGDVDLKFFRLEHPFAGPRFPGFDECVDHPFGFAEDAKICRLIEMRRRRRPGAADDDGLAARTAEIDDIERVVLLRQHAAGQDQIGPIEVVVAQLLGVAVDQPQRPRTRQQRR